MEFRHHLWLSLNPPRGSEEQASYSDHQVVEEGTEQSVLQASTRASNIYKLYKILYLLECYLFKNAKTIVIESEVYQAPKTSAMNFSIPVSPEPG